MSTILFSLISQTSLQPSPILLLLLLLQLVFVLVLFHLVL
ncbi:hypothetical protein E2C01_092034 [Portunus trituberculatus]|uniref:Uncharacterized protein n=1 Tax=Portunus trituberculatus TaxID=210409 RepID=A0A5B7JUQ4_PORTR|nr:hypothetical protein [Portunus trituberculatus]